MSSGLVAKLDALALRLSKTARDIESGGVTLSTDADRREDLAMAAEDVINTVCEPGERNRRIGNEIAHYTAIRLFIKWKAFEKIPTEPGAAISYAALAVKVGADEALIARFGRVLASNRTLIPVGSDSVSHTDLSRAYQTRRLQSLVEILFDNHFTSFAAMPRYFDHFGLTEPFDRCQSPLAFAENRLGDNVFEIIHSTPARHDSFMTAMSAFEHNLPALGSYDLSWVITHADKNTNRVLLIDVGGGKGQAVISMFKSHPDLPRRQCMLQDLPEVLEAAQRDNAEELRDVQMLAVDLHREQPVQGALVYYIRSCLHDYPPASCIAILGHIARAMAPDSRLLIAEMLLTTPATRYMAQLDLVIMCLSGKERTLEDYRDMLTQAGLRISGVEQNERGGAVIECVLA